MDTVATTSNLDRLYREHYGSLVRLAAILVDDVTTCEELVQDAFVAVLRRSGGWVDESSAPAYLRSAVMNAARSHLRKRQVRQRWLLRAAPPTHHPGADIAVLDDADTHVMLRALRSLPTRQREVLALRYYLDLLRIDAYQFNGDRVELGSGFVTGSGSPPAGPFQGDIACRFPSPAEHEQLEAYWMLTLWEPSAEDGSTVAITAIPLTVLAG